MELLGILAVIVVIVTPILAISAFIRVQRLADQLRSAPLNDLGGRLRTL
jgi:hypothetical protein